MSVRKLTPVVHEKVWGSLLTEPWVANPEGRRIGEIWFAVPDILPVLVKLLFTTERMSIQVHPGDDYAQAHGEARGKTEMWHVLRHDPGATVALGLREKVSGERLREAALNGDVVDLLNWLPARTGDTFFIPAGTVHAIGGGLVLCEVQQFSDVTYRLFDYHRQPERALHLEESLAVARLEPADCRRYPTPIGQAGELLAECEYFRTENLNVHGSAEYSCTTGSFLFIAIAGEGQVAGEPFRAGEGWVVEPGGPPLLIESPQATFVVVTTLGHSDTPR